MARLVAVDFSRHRPVISGQSISWAAIEGVEPVYGFPQLLWNDGAPWREANLWALRLLEDGLDAKTVQANMASLQAYASWLERTGTQWYYFPVRKADRCLIRYRGALIEARTAGAAAPSTVSHRMRVVIRFYRWLQSEGLFTPAWPMWRERRVDIRLFDPGGLDRTISIQTTDLAIPNRKRPGSLLEGGLLPLPPEDRDSILQFARSHATPELFLMLCLGFFTGMRLGTITDLKIATLDQASRDPAANGLWKLAVGPGADPPVATKHGVTGHIWIAGELLDALREYAYSVRRLKRQAKAAVNDRDLVFLTRHGNSYARRGTDRSPAINVELHSLKRAACAREVDAFRHFYFHQSRCTFATELARTLLSKGRTNALAIVQEALLHRSEATSLKYIRFVEESDEKVDVANAFARCFLGLASR